MKKQKFYPVLRYLLALLFFASAYTKLIAPGIVEIILVDQGIISNREIAAYLVRLLIGAEFALGLLLLQKYYLKRIILPAVMLFLSGFTIYLLYAALVLKESRNCGCFGTMLEMSPFESIIKNLVLLIITFFVYKHAIAENKRIIIPLILCAISVFAVFVLAPIKNSSDFTFGKYTDFAGAGRVDLASGEKLILLMTLDCDHCRQTAKDIVELKKKYDLPETYALFFQEGDVTVDSFKVLTGFSVPYKILGGLEFFEMIGTNPPRCYRVKEGRVLEFWDTGIKEKLIERYKNN
jgi:hypothetical protein